MVTRVGAGLAALALLAGCGGGGGADGDDLLNEGLLGESLIDDDDDAPSDGDGTEEETASEVVDVDRMPDVLGLTVEEATAQLEELGFRVSTGIVRTTEREPDLVHRSEPAPGQPVRENQPVTLRIAAEPRE